MQNLITNILDTWLHYDYKKENVAKTFSDIFHPTANTA